MVFPFSCCNGREQTFKFQYWSLSWLCARANVSSVYGHTCEWRLRSLRGKWRKSIIVRRLSPSQFLLSRTHKYNDRVNIDIRLLPITAGVIIGEKRSFYHHRKGTPQPIEWAGVINRVSQWHFFKDAQQQPRQKQEGENGMDIVTLGADLFRASSFDDVQCMQCGLRLLDLIFLLCNWLTLAITDVLSLTTHTNLDHVEQSHSL